MRKNAHAATATPRYVSIQYASKYLGLTDAGLRKFIAEGRIPAYRLGKRALRVDVQDLDNLLVPLPTASQGGRTK